MAPTLSASGRARAAAGARATALTGLLVVTILFFTARRAEWMAFDAEFTRVANREASLVERKLERLGFAVVALQQMVAAHDGLDRQEFVTFTQPFLHQYDDLIAIQWVPLVTDAARDSVERDIRLRISPQFRITEPEPDGQIIPARRRGDYFPVLYMASLRPNIHDVVGLDHGALRERRQLFESARDSGSFLVSPPAQLLMLNERGFFALAPVYRHGQPTATVQQRREALLGFVLAAYDLPKVLNDVIDSSDFRPLALTVLEYSLDGRAQTVYHSAIDTPEALGWPRWMLPDQLEQTAQLQFGGVSWGVRVTVTSEYLSNHPALYHWLILPIGLLFVALLTALVWTMLRRREKLEAMVNERTGELAAAAESMQRVLGAMDLAADGIMIVAPDNRVTYANRTLLSTIGATGVHEVVGRLSESVLCAQAELVSPDMLAAIRQEVRKSGSWKGEWTHSRSDGGQRRVLHGHIRMLEDGGRVVVLNDLTEARRRDEEQRRLEHQLEEARRLEVLGTLAASIAHDFNNLLGAILGFAQFIVDDTEEGAPLHRYGSRILKAGQQAKCLIGQILTFSHRREVPHERVRLNELVNENLSILRAVVAPTTTLNALPAANDPPVLGQHGELAQVLVNLVINASEALEGEEGQVTIALATADPDAPDMARLFAPSPGDGQSVQAWTDPDGWNHAVFGVARTGTCYRSLSVSDSGTGMDLETLSRIVSPFFTTKGKKGGTGLGLAVVQNIIAHHQGALTVRTAPGRGSTFTVLLPEAGAEGDAVTLAEEPSPTQASAGNQGTILLVENSPHFGDMLMTALFRLGYEIATCDDCAQALEYIDEAPEAWDLVITDQIMPGMTGTELVAAIKARHPALPCVVCTAYPGDLTEVAASDAGADGFVSKPLELGRFSLMIKELVGGRLAARAT